LSDGFFLQMYVSRALKTKSSLIFIEFFEKKASKRSPETLILP